MVLQTRPGGSDQHLHLNKKTHQLVGFFFVKIFLNECFKLII